MGNLDLSKLASFGLAIAVILAGALVIKIVTTILAKMLKKTPLDVALHRFITNGVGGVLWVVLIGAVLSYLGASISTFVAVVGAAGAAIALALKDSLANIAGGIIILITKPFKSGDYVEVNGAEGQVDSIDLLFTSLRTADNKVVRVPNGIISTSVTINYSEASKRRVDCQFCISYENSIWQAKEILSVIAEQCGLILSEPSPVIGVADQQNGCVLLDMKVWCETENYWTVKYFLEENVKLAFDEAGIRIPNPQMDVHIRK